MKMLKTYWLELLFFAVGLVGAVIAMPFLPASVPLQFQGDGVITRTGPKWAVFIIPVVQLLVCYGFHWWIGRCLEKLPALAHTLAGMERLLRVCAELPAPKTTEAFLAALRGAGLAAAADAIESGF